MNEIYRALYFYILNSRMPKNSFIISKSDHLAMESV